ncbi:MAG TPA: NAD-dependent epimerase/dehydratase family protein [Planctomycetota bacterium]|nr:NAD-dependent epimerase/dehydratase family protein [Planctomycetota bacterium]
MKILVTGGAGFIGSYIVRELVELGHDVVVYDAFVHYFSPLESNYDENLRRRFEGIEDRFSIVRGDTRNETEVRRCIMQHRPQRIIHLAALPLADLSHTHSDEAIRSILHGTVNILETLRDTDFVERFVYTSSSMVYGDFQHYSANEEHPKHPKDIYGGTKLAGEILTQSFSRRFGIEYTIIRPSAVYGPTDVNRRVSGLFIENAMRGEELVLHGGGRTKLDFTYVKDTAHGFVLATLAAEARNEVFNITRGEARSLLEFAEILKRHFPDLRMVVQPHEAHRPRRGTLDISKARELLGYCPLYPLEEGIAETVAYVVNGTLDHEIRSLKRGAA